MLIDGRETTALPADDRGLAYGDGVFETMRLTDGVVPLLDLHLERLAEGCRRLALTPPPAGQLIAEIDRVRAGQSDAVVKVVLTRGSGGRGYAPPAAPAERRIVSCHSLPSWPAANYTEGVGVWLCTTRLGRNPALAGLKHLGRLEQVLASLEPAPPGCAEGLMRDVEGAIVEGIRSNLFVVCDGVLTTPGLEDCGVAGVMRRFVLEATATAGLPAVETRLSLDELLAADEVFLTSSVFGIWPVARLVDPDRRWPVGPQTRQLMATLAARGLRGGAS
jgi:4-amino-4-deoxychorismate lyase